MCLLPTKEASWHTRRRGEQSNTAGRGQPGRRGTDPASPQKERYPKPGRRSPRRSTSARVPLWHGRAQRGRPRSLAGAGFAGPQAAQGGRVGGVEEDKGRREDAAVAGGDPHLLQGAAGLGGGVRVWG